MYSQRNETQEPEMTLQVNADELDKLLVDKRNGLRLGTMRQMCSQFGISILCADNKAFLTAKRDGMQMIIEKLHFCRIKYTTV